MPTSDTRVSYTQHTELMRVHKYETPEFGVILSKAIANALKRKGYVEDAARRRYARTEGICVRTTAAGRAYLDE